MRGLVALLLLAAPVAAQADAEPGSIRVEPAEVEEGRPVALRVEWTRRGADPAAVVRFAASGGGVEAALPGPVERPGLRLDPLPDVVTLDLLAREELGPQARAPRPPLVARLEGEPCVVLRQVVDGETLALTLVDVVPSVERPLEVKADVEHRRLAPGPDLAATDLLVRGPTRRWSPGQAPDLDPTSEPPGDPLGLRPGGAPGVGITVELVRWVPRGLGPSEEVLLRKAVVDRLGRGEVRASLAVKVKPARFGRAAALKRAGLAAADQAVRLDEATWLVDADGRVWLVPEAGEVASVPGAAGRLALALGRGAEVEVRFPPDAPAEATAGLVTPETPRDKDGSPRVRVGATTLRPALRAIEALKGALRDGQVVRGG